MKLYSIFSIAALVALTVFSACGNDAESADKLAGENGDASTGAPALNTAPAAGQPEPAQNAAGLWHYTCPKGCPGGAGAAGACAQCGTALVHSQAYHGTAPAAAPTGTEAAPGQAPVTLPNATKNEPPQNAAGVWHYTCTSGCAGGAGAATACASCGKKLEHNKAYHQ